MMNLPLKKLVSLAIAVALFCAAIPPKQAQAGVILNAISGENNGTEGGWLSGPIVGTGGIGMAAYGLVLIYAFPMSVAPYVMGTFAGVFVLDVDGSLPQDSLTEVLSARYAFIDNVDVTRELAARIGAKFRNQHQAGETKVSLSLTPQETRSILAPAGLAFEDEEQVVNDLK